MKYTYLSIILFTILFDYVYSFDCNIFPILKKLFNKNKNNNNYITRKKALDIKKYHKLSRYLIDKKAENIVGPVKNRTKYNNYKDIKIRNYTNFN